jgi:ABC-type nickel/cobalt efflux system permease component RcnA
VLSSLSHSHVQVSSSTYILFFLSLPSPLPPRYSSRLNIFLLLLLCNFSSLTPSHPPSPCTPTRTHTPTHPHTHTHTHYTHTHTHTHTHTTHTHTHTSGRAPFIGLPPDTQSDIILGVPEPETIFDLRYAVGASSYAPGMVFKKMMSSSFLA